MEYYIFEKYQKAKKENPDMEQGFDRLEPKIKGSLIGCFIALFVSCIEIMITIILFPTQFWHCIGIGGVVIAVIAFFVIDESNTKKHMDK